MRRPQGRIIDMEEWRRTHRPQPEATSPVAEQDGDQAPEALREVTPAQRNPRDAA